MALAQSDLLRVSAERREQQESIFVDLKPDVISELDGMLLGAFHEMRPNAAEYHKRIRLIEFTGEMVKQFVGKCGHFYHVQPFGSFLMDMFTATSDLDLSLNFNCSSMCSISPDDKIGILRKMVKLLISFRRQGRIKIVTPILKARVPIVKFVDRNSEIECDVSVENKDGFLKSHVILLLSSIDERCKILCCLVKAWAKAYGINCAKENSLSSIAVILLAIFHLQSRDPPILPPLSALLEDGVDGAKLQDALDRLKNFGRGNTETIAELFISLMNKLFSVKTLWEQGLCASTYEGSWIYKNCGSGVMSIQDFLDRSQNCARAVNKKTFDRIYSCIDKTHSDLRCFVEGTVTASSLKKLLFGPMDLQHTGKGFDHVSKGRAKKKAKLMKKNVGRSLASNAKDKCQMVSAGRSSPQKALPLQSPACTSIGAVVKKENISQQQETSNSDRNLKILTGARSPREARSSHVPAASDHKSRLPSESKPFTRIQRTLQVHEANYPRSTLQTHTVANMPMPLMQQMSAIYNPPIPLGVQQSIFTQPAHFPGMASPFYRLDCEQHHNPTWPFINHQNAFDPQRPQIISHSFPQEFPSAAAQAPYQYVNHWPHNPPMPAQVRHPLPVLHGMRNAHGQAHSNNTRLETRGTMYCHSHP